MTDLTSSPHDINDDAQVLLVHAKKLLSELNGEETDQISQKLEAAHCLNLANDKACIDVYQSILDKEPNNQEAIFALADCLAGHDEPLEAEKLLSKYISDNPNDAVALINLGNIKRQISDIESAKECYATALDIDKFLPDGYFGLALIAMDQKQYEPAIALFELVLKLNPNIPVANFNIALCYENNGAFEEALKIYKQLTASQEEIIRDRSVEKVSKIEKILITQ